MTANIAIADSLKALDFNRPNREEPFQQRDGGSLCKLFPNGLVTPRFLELTHSTDFSNLSEQKNPQPIDRHFAKIRNRAFVILQSGDFDGFPFNPIGGSSSTGISAN